MRALRRTLVAVLGLLNLAVAALFAVALIDHNFGSEVVDFMDRFLVYNLELWFVQSVNLWEPILLFLLFAVLGVVIICIACQRKRERRMLRVDMEDGNAIHISREAIDSVVKQAVSEITSVDSATTQLQISGSGLKVKLHLVIPSSSAVPEVGAQARQIVSERLQSILCIVPREIAVEVVNVVEKPLPLAKIEEV